MNKKIKLTLIIILVLLLCFFCYFIFFHRKALTENTMGLTLFEKLTFSDNEKFIFDELQKLKLSLLENKTLENEDTPKDISLIASNESVNFNDFCKNIYEIRRKENDNGELIYLFDMDILTNGIIARRKVITKNGDIISFSIIESDYDNVDSSEDNDDLISIDLTSMIYDGLNKIINETWENSTALNDVNIIKILKLV